MSKDIDDILKEITKSNKDLHKVDDKISKEIDSLNKDMQIIKRDVKTISLKIDQILELLMTLSVFIEDAENILDEEDVDEYSSNEGWLPEVNEWESHQEEYDEEDDG